MTFKGCRYATILELERLILVAKVTQKAYEFELKCRILQREKIEAEETEIKLNLQKKFVSELEDLEEELLNQIDIIADNLGDLEAQIFHRKFILGRDNDEIQLELGIERATLFRYLTKIDEAMKCEEGENIKTVLKE